MFLLYFILDYSKLITLCDWQCLHLQHMRARELRPIRFFGLIILFMSMFRVLLPPRLVDDGLSPLLFPPCQASSFCTEMPKMWGRSNQRWSLMGCVSKTCPTERWRNSDRWGCPCRDNTHTHTHVYKYILFLQRQNSPPPPLCVSISSFPSVLQFRRDVIKAIPLMLITIPPFANYLVFVLMWVSKQ